MQRPEQGWLPAQVIAFDYYDGPIEGVVRLRDSRVFRFKMVAEDADRDLRIFVLRPVSEDAFSTLVAGLTAELGEPRWPVWVPCWEFADRASQERADRAVEAIPIEPVAAVVAFNDSFHECAAHVEAQPELTNGVRDWFAFVGLE